MVKNIVLFKCLQAITQEIGKNMFQVTEKGIYIHVNRTFNVK